jgi:hypothetical protein
MSSGTTADSPESGIGRRKFLAGSLAGVVGSALVRLPAAHAQASDPEFPDAMFLGVDNVADGPTSLSHASDLPTLRVANTDSGPGVQVVTNKGPAVSGMSPGGGLIGVNEPITLTHSIAGVQGLGSKVGVVGSILPHSVQFTDTISAGVWGTTPVLPSTPSITLTNDIGVAGTAFGGDQIGVVAHNPTGLALSVVGGISVTCGGTGVVASGDRVAEIEDDSISLGSVVLVSLTGDPGNKGATVHHIRAGDGAATVSMTAPVRDDTPFTYLCFDLASR